MKTLFLIIGGLIISAIIIRFFAILWESPPEKKTEDDLPNPYRHYFGGVWWDN